MAVLGGYISRLLFLKNKSSTSFIPRTIKESLKFFVLSASPSSLKISWGLTNNFSSPCSARSSKWSEINLWTASPFYEM